MVDRDKVELTEEEKAYEADIEAGLYKPVEDLEAEKARLATIAKASKKRKSISIRVDEGDLTVIKKVAEKLGMPYQTLMNSILHQYATGK